MTNFQDSAHYDSTPRVGSGRQIHAGAGRLVRLLFLLPCALTAQPDRIAAPIDAHRTVVLKGNVHPLAQPRFDQAPA